MLHLPTYSEPSLNSSPSKSSRNCDDLQPEEALAKVIQMLKTQMDMTMNNLEESRAYIREDHDLMVFIKMVNAVELMQMHLELTLELLLSKSEEEVTVIKKKFSLISKDYDKIKTSKDMSRVTIQSVAAYMLDQMHRQLITVLEVCFRKTSRGGVRLLNTKDNLAQAAILTFKFEVGALYYPKFVTFPQDDIFSVEKSSPLWQDLYECAIYKKIITKQEIHASFKQLRLFLHMGYYLVKKYIQDKPEINFRTAFSLLHDVLYYSLQAEKVEIQSLLNLVTPNLEYIFKAWHATDHPLLVRAAGFRSPRIGHDQLIYIPRLFPAITRELILKEYEDGTINKLYPIDMSQMHVPDDETLSSMAPDIIEDLLVKSDEKVQVRILAHEKIKIQAKKNKSGRQGDHQENLYNSYMEEDPKNIEEQEQAIVIHIHGGGFVSMSSAGHKIYLTRWVKNLKLVHFSIDYRLAPKDPYPAGLDDVWQAYLWIMNYSSRVLGIKTPKVIFAGDSAGGNLCIVLALRLIRAGLPPPDGLLLIYPCLTLDETNCSPSYYNALEDPILHYNILKMCVKAYVSEEFDPVGDPFLSPLKACDELMKELPPVRIVTGSEDPLHDDSWRLVARLRKLKKDVKIIIHEHMGHGFLAHLDLKNYDQFVEEDCELIRELISIAPKK